MSLLIRPLARLPKIGLAGAVRAYKGVDLPLRGGTGTRQVSISPPGMEDMERAVGNERARRILRLRGKGIVGTLPELCTYDWLERKGYRFEFQSAQLGGRHTHGGAVVDFQIADISKLGWFIWRIQGEYWHAGREKASEDAMQKARLRGMLIDSIPVVAVVDLWESAIYYSWPRVYELAEAGVEMPL